MEINITDLGGGTFSVLIDGMEFASALTSVGVHMAARKPAEVTLDLVVIKDQCISIKDPVVIVPDATVAALKALGWTPPETTSEYRPLDISAALKVAETGTVVTS